MRLCALMLLGVVVCFGGDGKKPNAAREVDPQMTPEAHSSLFRAPESQKVGARTERTGGCPAGRGRPGRARR